MSEFVISSAPLVSIGVASFNNAAYLMETLESIRAQTYSNWEVIIVDDASHDNSTQLVAEWLAAHPNVRGQLLVNEVNRGICHTFNRFLDAASGEYLSIIGSDDTLRPDKLTNQVPMLAASPPRVGLLYGDVSKMDAKGRIFAPSVYDTGQIRPFSGNVWLELLKTNFLGAMSALIRRSCIERVGRFDEALAYEDWDMWLRISREFEFLYQPVITAHYRIHGGSALHQRKVQIIESNLRLLQKHLGVSAEGDAVIARHLRDYSEQLYLLGSSDSVQWLRQSWRQNRHWRGLALLTAARLGIPATLVSSTFGKLKKLSGHA